MSLEQIAAEQKLSVQQVKAVARLLDEGGSVLFIACYRKEATGSLDEVQVAAIRDRRLQLAELEKRREASHMPLELFSSVRPSYWLQDTEGGKRALLINWRTATPN
jgi:uncharacterized protein